MRAGETRNSLNACYIYMCIYTYAYAYMYTYHKIGPKCGKWDYGGLKSKNVGSWTLGYNNCGKWDFQLHSSISRCYPSLISVDVL